MSSDTPITRREAVAVGLAGATALLGLQPEDAQARPPTSRMPVVFLPHGGGPWPFVEMGFPKAETEPLAAYLRGIKGVAPQPPKSLLVISAHWEARVPTVMSGARPPMLYDYSSFPREAYSLTWPAPGNPALAARVQALLEANGFTTAADATRGFDHGTFVPLKLAWPAAEVPTVQLSLIAGLDPARHLALGKSLLPLRDEGVLIVGSGMSYHNMRGFFAGGPGTASETFDRWLVDATCAAPDARNAALASWSAAPSARECHPREEHLLPLMVCAGAAGADRGALRFSGHSFGKRISGFQFG